jgi:hypothetical protein
MRSMRCALLALALLALRVSEAAATGGPAAVRLPPISVAGAPRTLVTMAVAVPAELREAARIVYQVEMTGTVEVVGQLEGVLDHTSRVGSTRAVYLTLRVPADALVGLLDVADVTFSAPDGRAVVVPIILRVPAVRSIHVAGTREVRALRGGDRVELAYLVRNLGNSIEVLDLRVQAPGGWPLRLTGRSSRVSVAPHGETEFSFVVTVPPGTGAGDFSVTTQLRNIAREDSAVVGATSATLRVFDGEDRVPGLVFEPMLATSQTRSGGASSYGGTLNGPIGNGMLFSARVMPAPRQSGLAVLGLSSVGAIGAPFQATLSTEKWSVEAGNTGARLFELTGVNLWGNGLTGRIKTGRVEAIAVAIAPTGVSGARGASIGTAAWTQHEYGRFGVSLSSLREEAGTNGRQLNAVGADWTSNRFGSLSLGAGLAVRDMHLGTRLGGEARLVHERPGEMVRARLTYAPGGTRAYAPATEIAEFEANRVLTDRWSARAFASRTRDENETFSSVTSQSLNLSQNYQWTEALSVYLRASRASSVAEAASLGSVAFKAGNESINLGGQFNHGGLNLSLEGRYGAQSRETELLSGNVNSVRAPQRGVTVGVGRGMGRLGAFDAGVSLLETGMGVGMPAQMRSANLRWSAMPMMIGPQVIRLSLDGQYLSTSRTQQYVISRASAVTTLPGGFDLTMALERNPFFRDATGRAGVVFAMKLTTSTEVFSTARFAPPGVVYEDLNGNGERDAGEKGVAGVVLRQGDVRVTSNREGAFRVPTGVRGVLRVDPRSIPVGFVAHPRYATDSLERREVPLVPTGSIVVALTVVADSAGRRPDVDLAQSQLWLRDASGLQWVGVAMGDGSFRFDQVPIGSYGIRIDFSRVTEPLRIDESTTIEVVPGAQSVRLIEVRGRAIRLSPPSPRSGNGRGGNVGRGGGRGASR